MLHGKLLADESLGERTATSADQVTHTLDLCLQTTYFLHKGEYYQQKNRVAMGSVSPVVANVYMKMFEDLALKTKLASRIWRRYVDDTFCVNEELNARHFPDHLNSLCPLFILPCSSSSLELTNSHILNIKYDTAHKYMQCVLHANTHLSTFEL